MGQNKSFLPLFLGHRSLIKKITQTAVINIVFQLVLAITPHYVKTRTAADHFSQSRFQTSNVYDIYIYIYITEKVERNPHLL